MARRRFTTRRPMREPESAGAAARRAGFERWDTGGGCTAWGRALEGGAYVMVTDLDANAPDLLDPTIVGIYSGDDEAPQMLLEFPTFSAFLKTLES